MIVVVGPPAWRGGEPGMPAGRTCEIALAAAGTGARAELVGRIGDDPIGDRLLIALAQATVGHAAVLRDPTRPTPVVAAAPEPEPEPEDAFADVVPVDDAATDPSAPAPAGPRLQAADVALGLQYLTAFGVLVVADDAPIEVLPACVDGAAFAGASLVVLVREGSAPPADLPAAATVLEVPARDDGAFGALVGLYAARLDAGDDPAQAFSAALGEGWAAPLS
jgi:hypothetical protein